MPPGRRVPKKTNNSDRRRHSEFDITASGWFLRATLPAGYRHRRGVELFPERGLAQLKLVAQRGDGRGPLLLGRDFRLAARLGHYGTLSERYIRGPRNTRTMYATVRGLGKEDYSPFNTAVSED